MTNSQESNSTPQRTLMRIAEGYRLSLTLQTATEMGIADLLKDSPKTCEVLAEETATDAASLYRLMRALASEGIFREDEEGRFENTPLSDVLRVDAPNSARGSVLHIPNDRSVRSWMRLMDVIKTGKPSFKDATGYASSWEFLQQHPELEKRFNENMALFSAYDAKVILENCDFSAYNSIVDLGGGKGLFIASLLEAYPQLNGTVFEVPTVAEEAKGYLNDLGFSERSGTVAGSIFEEIPAGFDAYTIKNVLHDWNDDEVLQVLRGCRKVIPDHGKLIIFDTVMLPGNDPHSSKWIDMHMMVTLGGRERTAEEFAELLEKANFKMTKATPLSEFIGVVEAVPAN